MPTPPAITKDWIQIGQTDTLDEYWTWFQCRSPVGASGVPYTGTIHTHNADYERYVTGGGLDLVAPYDSMFRSLAGLAAVLVQSVDTLGDTYVYFNNGSTAIDSTEQAAAIVGASVTSAKGSVTLTTASVDGSATGDLICSSPTVAGAFTHLTLL